MKDYKPRHAKNDFNLMENFNKNKIISMLEDYVRHNALVKIDKATSSDEELDNNTCYHYNKGFCDGMNHLLDYLGINPHCLFIEKKTKEYIDCTIDRLHYGIKTQF